MDLSYLNEAQRAAILCDRGPLMVLAGAGSGKTRTLVAKIIYLIEEKRLSPYQILAMTFSNKAAKEMRDRVSHSTQTPMGALQITTFHAFCAHLMRTEAKYLGLSRNFTIYDDSESKAVVKGLLSRRGISQKDISPYEILDYIDTLKNKGHFLNGDSEGFDLSHPFYSYFVEYEEELAKSSALDFGGLITSTLKLLTTFPELRKKYQKRYRYFLVDEYQDTNRAQFNLICLLVGDEQNICVVGDEDQSIYSWRGADINNILDFEKKFPDVQTIKLEQNYRSSKTIIDAATHVINQNVQRKGKTMWTSNPQGDLIRIIETPSDRDEAEVVVEDLAKKIAAGTLPGEGAIFYRNNAQSRTIEEALLALKIPYRIVGGIKFYERKEIKDMLAYLRLLTNIKDSLALTRIINVPARGVGATTLRNIEIAAIEHNISLFEAIELLIKEDTTLETVRISSKARSALAQFVHLINECQNLVTTKENPSQIFEKIFVESGYQELIKATKDYETVARLENLDELRTALLQFEQRHEGTKDSEGDHTGGLDEFLASITLQSVEVDPEKQTQLERQNGQISLMTIHGAKGLEFDHVYLVGLENNIFPSFRSLEQGPTALEEERRLFYVAMTRAMKELVITFAQSRMLFGSIKFNGPSQFLDEIPGQFCKWERINKVIDKRRDEFNQEYFDQDESRYQTKQAKVVSRVSSFRFPCGSDVRHRLYGEGKVIECEGQGKEEKVVIKFIDGSKKKFMVDFAPLSRLET